MNVFIEQCLKKATIKRSIKVAIIVGSVLGLINHSDAIFNGTLTSTNISQMGLTYMVPYLVATYGAASQAAQTIKNQEKA